MTDWADEWAVKIARRASEAADAPFYEREVDLAAPVIAQALRAARAEGIEAAAKVAERVPACPFDGPTTLEPEDPCPVCADLGTDIDAPSHCRSAATAIRALLTETADADLG